MGALIKPWTQTKRRVKSSLVCARSCFPLCSFVLGCTCTEHKATVCVPQWHHRERAKARTVRDVVTVPNILSKLSAGVLTSSSMSSTYSTATSSLYAGTFAVPLSPGPDLRTQVSMVATTERRLQLHCDASDHLRRGSGLSVPVQPVGMTCDKQWYYYYKGLPSPPF